VEIFVIAIVPRTCWVVQNHKIGASDEATHPGHMMTTHNFSPRHVWAERPGNGQWAMGQSLTAVMTVSLGNMPIHKSSDF
jgi:hypothetical protein